MKEEESPNFIKDNLMPELRRRVGNQAVQVVSDFDETLCDHYLFSESWQTHVPIISQDLVRETRQLSQPLCIATARGTLEPTAWVIWHQLSKLPMPLVTENGAVLLWPGRSINDKPRKVTILASIDQIRALHHLQTILEVGLSNQLAIPKNHQIILRQGRLATVELRTEDKQTKKGTPEDHKMIVEQIRVSLPENIVREIEFTDSGSSLGIQPKGINKGRDIAAALKNAGIDPEAIFMIGLGDNQNDESLFAFVKKYHGLTIGVRPETNEFAEFTLDGGETVSLNVLKNINLLRHD